MLQFRLQRSVVALTPVTILVLIFSQQTAVCCLPVWPPLDANLRVVCSPRMIDGSRRSARDGGARSLTPLAARSSFFSGFANFTEVPPVCCYRLCQTTGS